MSDIGTIPAKDQTNYLLGGLNAKMDTVIGAQVGYETRLRAVENGVASLQATAPRRVGWWTIAAGIASILAIFGTIVVAVIYLTH